MGVVIVVGAVVEPKLDGALDLQNRELVSRYRSNEELAQDNARYRRGDTAPERARPRTASVRR